MESVDFGNVIPTALDLGGRFMQSRGLRSAGRAARQAGQAEQYARNIEADALVSQAETQIGIGQIEKRDTKRETDLIVSNAIAAAAKQGGTKTDPSTLRIIARIQQEGAYRGQVAMYNREENARGLRIQAIARRYAGEVANVRGRQEEAALQTQGNIALLKGGQSLYDRYGRDWFQSDSSPQSIATDAAVSYVPGYK